jgi:hypothetical protein
MPGAIAPSGLVVRELAACELISLAQIPARREKG